MARVIAVNSEALGGNFEPIPVGTKLKVAVYEIEETVTGPNSKKPGSPQFVFTAKVTEDGEFKGREIKYNYISLDPGAPGAWALAAFAEAVGWPIVKGDDGKASISLPDNLSDVLGTEFIAKMGHSNSQKINEETGKPYVNNRVTGFAKVKAGGGGGTPQPETKKSWDEL